MMEIENTYRVSQKKIVDRYDLHKSLLLSGCFELRSLRCRGSSAGQPGSGAGRSGGQSGDKVSQDEKKTCQALAQVLIFSSSGQGPNYVKLQVQFM